MFGDLTSSWAGVGRGEVRGNEESGNLGQQRKLLAKKVRDECRRGGSGRKKGSERGNGTCVQGHW